jgi:hypothetical protein
VKLTKLLEYFEIKQDSIGIERAFFGFITITEFENSIKNSISEANSQLKRSYDLNIINSR